MAKSSKISAKDVESTFMSDLGGASKEYVDQQITQVTGTGIPKLMVYPLSVTASTEGQTVFNISLDTFSIDTDTVFVQSGRTMLSPNDDFTVQNKTVVLNEGVPKDRILTIYVFKNVPIGEDGSVSGSTIAKGSLPLDRLAQMPTASDVGAVCYQLPTYGNITGTLASFFDTLPDNASGVRFYSACSDAPSDLLNGVVFYNRVKGFSNSTQVMVYYAGIFRFGHYVHSTKQISWGGGGNDFLKLSGGTLSGDTIEFADGAGLISGALPVICLEIRSAKNDTSNRRMLKLISATSATLELALRFQDIVNGSSKYYNVFGEHNKPSGSYTGNGNATARTINVGGVSRIILIRGDAYNALVGAAGGFWWSTSGDYGGIQASEVRYADGILTISSVFGAINKNTVIYYYQVL